LAAATPLITTPCSFAHFVKASCLGSSVIMSVHLRCSAEDLEKPWIGILDSCNCGFTHHWEGMSGNIDILSGLAVCGIMLRFQCVGSMIASGF
jgi:hypothetical protein